IFWTYPRIADEFGPYRKLAYFCIDFQAVERARRFYGFQVMHGGNIRECLDHGRGPLEPCLFLPAFCPCACVVVRIPVERRGKTEILGIVQSHAEDVINEYEEGDEFLVSAGQ